MRQTLLALFVVGAFAQTAAIRSTGVAEIPTLTDGNSPGFWVGEEFRLLTSTGAHPVIMAGGDHYTLSPPTPIQVEPADHYPIWIEAVWVDEDGTVFGWYHHEPQGLCGPNSDVTAPVIGAVVSFDSGETWADLGIVLQSGAFVDCNAGNELFGGGNGDFSVIQDQNGEYLYFVFTNYGGHDENTQGVAMARLLIADRWEPAGNVWKYHDGGWEEPGLGGRVTPVFPARVSWSRTDADSFWGPSVHWNTYLQKYVMLMNRSCCKPRWPQEGIYVSYSGDLANPGSWKNPVKVLDGEDINWRAGYYPQVLGDYPDGTDRLAGRTSRLYISGKSRWEITFSK